MGTEVEGGWKELGDWDAHIYTTDNIYKIVASENRL